MPNHAVTEIVFSNVTAAQSAEILAVVGRPARPIDFSVLLPPPINFWSGSVGRKHEDSFPGTQMDWSTENWGTKWNAYGISDGYQSIIQTDTTLTLTFQTAWSRPIGWLCALFNSTSQPFNYSSLSEGGAPAVVGSFRTEGKFGDPEWEETEADELTGRRLHKLLWGVESFGDDE